jgi:hypothetical protein
LRVGWLAAGPQGAEERAARDWLAHRQDLDLVHLDGSAEGAAVEVDVVWLHCSAEPDARQPALRRVVERLDAGGVLLSLAAAMLPARIGAETVAPRLRHGIWHDVEDELFPCDGASAFPRMRGHAAFRRHPVFQGLGSATFTWRPRDSEAFTTVTYEPGAWPDAGRVIAVERSYMNVNARRATIWEALPRHAPGRQSIAAPSGSTVPTPRVVCVGAYLSFLTPDPRYRLCLDRLAANALRWAAGVVGAPGPVGAVGAVRVPARYWPAVVAGVRQDAGLRLNGTIGVSPDLTAGRLELPSSALELAGAVSGPARPVMLAGRRAFAAGDEAAGIQELWVHPLRAFSSLSLSLDGTPAVGRRARISPLGMVRELAGGVEERAFVPGDAPGGMLEWQAGEPCELTVAFIVDLRLMWPYPAGSLGSLSWNVDGDVLLVRADEGDAAAFLAAADGGTVEWRVAPADGAAVRAELSARLPAAGALRLTAAVAAEPPEATSAGGSPVRRLDSAVAALADSRALVAGRLAAGRRLANNRLAVTATDTAVGEAVEWAKHRLASYVVTAPGVGRGLVAGYSSPTSGGAGGRPGCTGYFGGDAMWTALACLGVGEFDAVADTIRLLGRHQDPAGRIPHQCTTSGVAQHEPDDATVSYLLLVARYLAWTGDGGAVVREHEHIRAAYRHAFPTDRHVDLRTSSEGSERGASEAPDDTTAWLDAAGVRSAALAEMKLVAEALGDAAWATELTRRAGRARSALQRRLVEDTTEKPTALPAAAVALGALDPEAAPAWLTSLAGPDFAAGWGVRLVPQSDPAYDPASRRSGAVSPLFTGWASWAAFAAGRTQEAAALWRINLERIPSRHQRGAWPEALHGEEERLLGTCSDSAGSTAMAIVPLVYGLLGVVPDAPRHRLGLRPQLPAAWNDLQVQNLRLGDNTVALTYKGRKPWHTFRLRQEQGGYPLTVAFQPAVPAGALLEARVDGRTARLQPRPFGERTLVPVQLVLDREREIALRMADPSS